MPFGFCSCNAYTGIGSHRSSLPVVFKGITSTFDHPKPLKQFQNYQILLNIGGVMATISLGPRCKRPPTGVQGSKNLIHVILTYYDPKSTKICNKVNFDKQIRREDIIRTTWLLWVVHRGCSLAIGTYANDECNTVEEDGVTGTRCACQTDMCNTAMQSMSVSHLTTVICVIIVAVVGCRMFLWTAVKQRPDVSSRSSLL